MARSTSKRLRGVQRLLWVLGLGLCFLVSGHPIVVSVGQEATCRADGTCCCTEAATLARSPGGCTSCDAGAVSQGCCGQGTAYGSVAEEARNQGPHEDGPKWERRCQCGGDGPVVVTLGSSVRFEPRVPGIEPKARTAVTSRCRGVTAPESWITEPTGPVPWGS